MYPQVKDSARFTSRAGEGIRTPDVQLGNPTCEPRNSLVVKGVTSSPSLDCTAACISEPETANGPAADPLADFVASLTAEQRQRLAALLIGRKEGGE